MAYARLVSWLYCLIFLSSHILIKHFISIMVANRQEYTVNGRKILVERFDFCPENGGGERHLMLHLAEQSLPACEQMEVMSAAYRMMVETEADDFKPVFRRLFLSDAANQEAMALAAFSDGSPVATSVVEQPPLDRTKIALWVYMVQDVDLELVEARVCCAKRQGYSHFWGTSPAVGEGDSEAQTKNLLSDYAHFLSRNGLSLADDCIRTWFFVQNVDVNYQGVVDGRNRIFDEHDLTEQTHFITSTGIGGRTAHKGSLVKLDTYSVGGLAPEQIKFLQATDFLNPTYEYGVRFERGTTVDYGDRRHVFISGTASIDNRGEVVAVGDIERQTLRMWDNVEALLKAADCGFEDVSQMLVYLRDTADYELVKTMFEQRFPNTPKVILLAPVCRPTWLIEMECMAVKAMVNNQFPAF